MSWLNEKLAVVKPIWTMIVERKAKTSKDNFQGIGKDVPRSQRTPMGNPGI